VHGKSYKLINLNIDYNISGMPWLRRLVTGLSLRRSGYAPGSVHAEFVVDKMTAEQVFLRIIWLFPVNIILPNVVVEWLTLLLCIREVPGSYLDPETRNTELLWFPLTSPGECQDSTFYFGHDCFLPNPLKFIVHISPFH
jgi:hypothetical protein